MWSQPIIKINVIDILLANVLKSWLTALLLTFWLFKYGFALWNTDICKGHLLSITLEACDFERCINTLHVCCCAKPQLLEVQSILGWTWVLELCRLLSGSSWFLTGRWLLFSCCLKSQRRWAVKLWWPHLLVKASVRGDLVGSEKVPLARWFL